MSSGELGLRQLRLWKLEPESNNMLLFDLFRFLAAMGIVLHHSLAFLYKSSDRLLVKQNSFGMALFVDLFFAISGFVICHVYAHRINTWSGYLGFLKRRAARLLPLHFFVTMVFVASIFTTQLMGVQMNSQMDISSTCVAKTLLLVHALLPCNGAPPNSVSWSISVEMVFYVMFPALVLVSLRSLRLISLSLVVVAVLVLSFGKNAAGWTELYPLVRGLPSFLFGVLLHSYRDRLPIISQRWYRWLMFLVGCMFVALVIGMLTAWSSLVLLGMTYVMLALAAMLDTQPSSSSFLKFGAGLGQLSYSIYMVHLFFITIIVNIFGDKILHLSTLPMFSLVVFNASFVLYISFLSLRYFETPARQFLIKRL